MKKCVCALLLLLPTAFAIGCDDSTPTNLYTLLAETESSAISDICVCYMALGTMSAQECAAELSEQPTGTEAECLRQVYADNRDELLAGVSCERDAYQAAQSCINNANMCDQTAVDACVSAAMNSFDACPEPSMAIEMAIDACDTP